ncbi:MULTISPECIES: FAD-dependent monooxygenase [Streptomyces]|uniref:2-polyprenyl-6-methoxyphenol hydroxylase and related FAD-dependent oxidoreductases n=2 Tax=Streptomyces venezuelae TaxID=54571 RepID=F2RC20_STRVP|nr:FAD-dependent monooxygenase [Streptomyces venezuelae]AAV52246.1 JadF [Streptomyces venezuelae]APE24776.1 oxidoreductase [Streptomyces venezuelae]QES02125.1 oxidoreductase [Streptomyces venezuelae ATCC 10712]CCA59271.1 2-polyprenyl-6-methoxyphenol hydroxylase and related FAD-dependent oxidoreductases [Streptomyces venezuelae ATCC 10712]
MTEPRRAGAPAPESPDAPDTPVLLDADVVVIGAGPTGLMLAGELRLGGADVIVLESRETPTTESRASTLHARTMELLDDRGLLTPLGTPPSEPRGHFGGIPLDLTLPGRHPGQWKVEQTRTEALLQEWATGLGADVRRGHTLRSLTVTETYAEAGATGPGGRDVRVRARYAVGCDGERSTVRALAGAEFPGQEARRELLRADVAGIDVPDRRFQRLPGGLAVAACRNGVTRVMVHEFGRPAVARTGEPEFAEVVDVWKRVTGEDISGGTPLWVNSFHDANRQLTRYRDGRVLWAGDAAHQQMPIGGQALNLGLQDAVNLGWKLAAVVRGTAPDGLLDTYHDERHAVGRQVLGNIRAQALLLLGGPEAEPVRSLLGPLIALDDVRAHLAGKVSGLDIRYGAGAADVHPLTGTRLPRTALVDDGREAVDPSLRAGQGLFLTLDPSGTGPGTGAAAAAAWAGRVGTAVARPVPGGVLDGLDAVLVRPDGYLAWTSADGAGPEAALHRWFGAPTHL